MALAFSLALPVFAGNGSTPAQARRIHFVSGATTKIVSGHLTKVHFAHYYKIKMRAGQRLSIKVTGTTRDGIVPLIFVTSPSGVPTTDKIYRYDVYPTESGDYLVRVAPNLMASNGTSGGFLLKVWAK